MGDSIKKWTNILYFILMSALLILVFQMSSFLMCRDRVYSLQNIKSASNLVVINGKLIDVNKLVDPAKITTVKPFQGLDVSANFPTFTVLARNQGQNQVSDPDLARCIGTRTNAVDAWLTRRLAVVGYRVDNNAQLINCPLPNGAQGPCFFRQTDKPELVNAIAGDILYFDKDISDRGDIARSNVVVTIRGRVYDVGLYLNLATSVNNGLFAANPDTAFFGEPVTSQMIRSAGKDMTPLFETLPNKEDLFVCFNKLFYAGVALPQAVKIGCTLVQPVHFALIIAILLVLLPRYLMALFVPLGGGKQAVSDAYIMFAINCGGESVSSLKRSIESAILSTYRDSQKLLFIICDGQRQNKMGGALTEDLVLDLLGFRGRPSSQLDYTSVGCGVRSINTGVIYSGHIVKDGRRVPYVVVSKYGSTGDSTDNGMRGPRDSLLLLMGFLNKLLGQSSMMTSLEYELYCTIRELKFDPRRFEYLLVMGADMEIDREVPSKLVNRLDTDEKISIILGKTETSGFSIMQKYPDYLRRHISVMYKSLWGSLMGSSENCYMIRLKYSDGSPCVLQTEILLALADQYDRPRTMYDKILSYQSEDKHLGYKVFEHDHNYRVVYEPSAVTKINPVPVSLLLEQEKVRYISYFALLVKGCSSKSMKIRFLSFVSLTAMMLVPALTGYCYYLIGAYALSPYNFSYIIPVAAFILLHFICLTAALVTLDFTLMLSVLNYLVFGIPFYQLVVPIYALFTMDSTSVALKHREMKVVSKHPCIFGGVPPSTDKRTLAQWNTSAGKGGANAADSSDTMSMLLQKPDAAASRTSSYMKQPPPIKSVNTKNSSTTAAAGASRKDIDDGYSMANEIQDAYAQSASDWPTRDKSIVNKHTPSNSTVQPPKSAAIATAALHETKSVATTKSTHYRQLNNKRDTWRKSKIEDLKKSMHDKFMSRPDSVMSQDTIRAPVESLYHKKKQSASSSAGGQKVASRTYSKVDDLPVRAISTAGSDYLSVVGGDDDRSSMAFNRTTQFTEMGTLGRGDLVNEDHYAETGITREEIKDEIHAILQDSDLNEITRREVKEMMFDVFGENVEFYNDYINLCVEEYTLERLALL